jgi:hypothetical protein
MSGIQKRLVYKTSTIQNVQLQNVQFNSNGTNGSQDTVEDHIAFVLYFESQKSPLMHVAALLIHAAGHREHAQGSKLPHLLLPLNR